MKICFVPSDVDGVGSYRCLFPMEQLARHGHTAALPPYQQTDKKLGELTYDFSRVPDADLFVFQQSQQQDTPLFILRLRALGKIVVGESDDDWLNLPHDHPAREGTAKHGAFNRFHMLKGLRACDAVTVSTPALKRSYETFHPDVHVLPNYLYWGMWDGVTPQYELERRVRVGWMGQMKFRPQDVAIMKGFVPDFLRDHPEVDFVAAGEEGLHDLLDVPEGQRLFFPPCGFRRRPDLNDLSPLPELTATMDIGLVPLVHNVFNESKSALKGMEYAACGIPCVASPTGPYRDWVQPGRNGFLADTPREWRQALETLLDETTRRRMGMEARKKAKAFSIERHWQEWADLYLELKHRPRYVPGQIAAEFGRAA